MSSLEELTAFDSKEGHPMARWTSDEGVARIGRIERLAARLQRTETRGWVVQGPSEFQDGSLFITIWENDPRLPGATPACLSFSSYGDLFCQIPGDASLDPARKSWLVTIVGTDCGFIHVPFELLGAEYAGGLCPYRCATWYERFFAGIHSLRRAGDRGR